MLTLSRRLASSRASSALLRRSTGCMAPLAHLAPKLKMQSLLATPAGRRWLSSGSLPDHTVLEMPALSPTMEAGNLVEWHLKEGDEITAGSAMAEVETDKATIAFESVDDGYLAKILMPGGSQDVPVGTPVAIMVEEEEDVAAFKDYSPDAAEADSKTAAAAAAAEAPKEQAPEKQQQQQAKAAPSRSSGERVFASPLARSLAAEKGIDVAAVPPTGPNGRVIADDVREFTPQQAQQAKESIQDTPGATAMSSGDFEDIPHSNVRKVIARRLTQSKQTVPHYYLSIDCSIDKLLEVRAQLNKHVGEQGDKLSVNDFFVKASALALQKVPAVNSAWMDDAIRQYNYADISVAVSTDYGLVTPIVKDADLQGLVGISRSVKDLAARARDKKLKPEEMDGGTFSISNLGMFGVTNFSAIINPPQAAILAVGAGQKRLVPGDSDAEPYKVANVVSVTLSCDHRVIDGATGAEWLSVFRTYIEDPMKMLL
eukprot:TRINITY_DN68053_c11_g1_i1.p1 TRINITY_DN68053_c11_g1~~TRINITY_DN68053_c11_g1_i1.p1  ORF type:complete len:501 (+),score=290.27 TRINITY_DN68053_c11_g1_i1:50-1504(+)